MPFTTQEQFAAALRDSALPVPDGIASWNAARPLRRFGIYRNNVISGLVGAVASRFPVTERLVGEEFFSGMAYQFICLHPPRSPLLLAYGDDFADFVESFEPALEIGYLADVIRLEAARGKAYHAADAAPLAADRLATLREEQLASLVFIRHPSASVIRSAHPAVTIWAMNAGQMPFAPIEDWRGEDALVIRPEMIVEVHRLPPGGAQFLDALFSGASFAAAAGEALAAAPEFDLSANLAAALQAGVFTDLSTGDDDE
ncbi:DUF2063 domain-containing protein (plasmid) [Rhizobium grahamii]|uniref:DUF2063 domain-containing protein n=1 Tax=Rhizobium grahamii TaxID=1120045 RepID=A0A5Q0CGT8_9HYPH|nr:DNA-binding domain-containing protein [Rhizobium grahamii]QFY63189.1 DUF2063 domain-containing protein [Rhizobium grahamii]